MKKYEDIIAHLQSMKSGEDEMLDEAMDIIYDYEKAVEQTQDLLDKYETLKPIIDRGMGNWQCPTCQKFISFGNEHCHWCGQKIEWEPDISQKGGKGRCRRR